VLQALFLFLFARALARHTLFLLPPALRAAHQSVFLFASIALTQRRKRNTINSRRVRPITALERHDTTKRGNTDCAVALAVLRPTQSVTKNEHCSALANNAHNSSLQTTGDQSSQATTSATQN